MKENQMQWHISQIRDVADSARKMIVDVIKALVIKNGMVEERDGDGKPLSYLYEFRHIMPSGISQVNGEDARVTITSIYLDRDGLIFTGDAESRDEGYGDYEGEDFSEDDFFLEYLINIASCIQET